MTPSLPWGPPSAPDRRVIGNYQEERDVKGAIGPGRGGEHVLLSPRDQTGLPEEPSGRMHRKRPGGNREGIPGRGNGRLEGPQMQMG